MTTVPDPSRPRDLAPGAVFGRRWFLAIALRQAPAESSPPPSVPTSADENKECDECAS